ncbi:hypothetical protein [Cellulomonas sp. KRMCY2]|uniref:hypothetical protein n=1 Tax=Cellulomonas sp. KRMCY2 TaxID=1304865 RepID=UPI00045EBF7F|nr:hypothetical protein [Cellulomonas sp. KRMCY2]
MGVVSVTTSDEELAGQVTTGPATPATRAALARAALARVEERTGTGPWVRPARRLPAEMLPGPQTMPAPYLPEVEPSTPVEVDPEAAERLLPVPAPLARLLPAGALARGSTVVVAGSTSLALALLSQASAAGSWVALVGLPGVGVLAAHQLGLDLDRVVLVPAPGPDGPTVVAALLDGVDVVVVGPQVALGDADRRRLSARARERSAVLLSMTAWPGAHVVLTAEVSHWEGLGRGYGRLRSRRLTVQRSGRGMASRGHRVDVTVPDGPRPWGDDVPVTLVPGPTRSADGAGPERSRTVVLDEVWPVPQGRRAG